MPLKILYSCPLDPVRNSAPGYHVASVVNELLDLRHDVEVVHKGPVFDGVDSSRQHALMHGAGSLFKRLFSDLSYARAIRRLVKNKPFDLVYHRMEKWSVLPMLLTWWCSIPTIAELNADVRCDLKNQEKGWLQLFLYGISEKIQVWSAGKVVVVSEGIRSELVRRHPRHQDKIIVVENGTDQQVFHPKDRSECIAATGLRPSKKYVTFAGTLQEWQGLETLVESAPIVAKQFPEVQFLIIGEGPMKEGLLKQIDDLKIAENVTMVGWLESTELVQYLGASDVCAAPYSKKAAVVPEDSSRPTGEWLLSRSPLKIFTYMAVGKPVVASEFLDCGVRVRNWDSGRSFQPDDAMDLANSILELLNDPELAESCGQRGLKQVLAHHTWKKVTEKIVDIAKPMLKMDP